MNKIETDLDTIGDPFASEDIWLPACMARNRLKDRTLIQKIFSTDLFFYILAWASTVTGALLFGGTTVGGHWALPSIELLCQADFLANYIPSIMLGGIIGFFATPVGLIPLCPFFRLLEKLNGAPFQVGDQVMILRGPHHGKIAEIYEIWESRNQVRLDLGPAEKCAVTDCFCYMEICRVLDDSAVRRDLIPG